jgi:hypothetical protein
MGAIWDGIVKAVAGAPDITWDGIGFSSSKQYVGPGHVVHDRATAGLTYQQRVGDATSDDTRIYGQKAKWDEYVIDGLPIVERDPRRENKENPYIVNFQVVKGKVERLDGFLTKYVSEQEAKRIAESVMSVDRRGRSISHKGQVGEGYAPPTPDCLQLSPDDSTTVPEAFATAAPSPPPLPEPAQLSPAEALAEATANPLPSAVHNALKRILESGTLEDFSEFVTWATRGDLAHANGHLYLALKAYNQAEVAQKASRSNGDGEPSPLDLERFFQNEVAIVKQLQAENIVLGSALELQLVAQTVAQLPIMRREFAKDDTPNDAKQVIDWLAGVVGVSQSYNRQTDALLGQSAFKKAAKGEPIDFAETTLGQILNKCNILTAQEWEIAYNLDNNPEQKYDFSMVVPGKSEVRGTAQKIDPADQHAALTLGRLMGEMAEGVAYTN